MMQLPKSDDQSFFSVDEEDKKTNDSMSITIMTEEGNRIELSKWQREGISWLLLNGPTRSSLDNTGEVSLKVCTGQKQISSPKTKQRLSDGNNRRSSLTWAEGSSDSKIQPYEVDQISQPLDIEQAIFNKLLHGFPQLGGLSCTGRLTCKRKALAIAAYTWTLLWGSVCLCHYFEWLGFAAFSGTGIIYLFFAVICLVVCPLVFYLTSKSASNPKLWSTVLFILKLGNEGYEEEFKLKEKLCSQRYRSFMKFLFAFDIVSFSTIPIALLFLSPGGSVPVVVNCLIAGLVLLTLVPFVARLVTSLGQMHLVLTSAYLVIWSFQKRLKLKLIENWKKAIQEYRSCAIVICETSKASQGLLAFVLNFSFVAFICCMARFLFMETGSSSTTNILLDISLGLFAVVYMTIIIYMLNALSLVTKLCDETVTQVATCEVSEKNAILGHLACVDHLKSTDLGFRVYGLKITRGLLLRATYASISAVGVVGVRVMSKY